jgi:hypothetical protein
VAPAFLERDEIVSEFLNQCVVPLTVDVAIASLFAMPFFRSLSTAVDREGLIGGSVCPDGSDRARCLAVRCMVLGSSAQVLLFRLLLIEKLDCTSY